MRITIALASLMLTGWLHAQGGQHATHATWDGAHAHWTCPAQADGSPGDMWADENEALRGEVPLRRPLLLLAMLPGPGAYQFRLPQGILRLDIRECAAELRLCPSMLSSGASAGQSSGAGGAVRDVRAKVDKKWHSCDCCKLLDRARAH